MIQKLLALATEQIDIRKNFGATRLGFEGLIDDTKYNAPQFIRLGIQFLFTSAAVASFLFLLIGGVQWILAGGDKEGVEKARKKIMGAVIGLSLVLGTYALATLSKIVLGTDILIDLKIPTI